MYRLVLPFPPSNNTYYRHVDNKVVLSKKGRLYKADVAKVLESYGYARLMIDKPVICRLELYRPDKKKKWDSDNYFKGVYDSLSHAGFWVDDHLVVESQARKMEPDGLGRVVVNVDYDMGNTF
ncbi:RusA family crossover junction endodeoxyribonuclease [Endozoicomonas sp. G2_1]|uniref:RusA family crossover junction endodeoxyribonuclease n=1 Tax=Endozoicomonas sp. G2_1 TaxID=2821091 RepID=UPI001ADB9498|nr:RusA family crossover junction endodeoxyribonuclease [Endozoicomonas sp. G2_1]MBO9492093.1 RusA family crossover junction endodeoxyribonuclease [Endozoicomonas sp. G2_1]